MTLGRALIRDADAATKFEAHFERMWGRRAAEVEFGPAIEALERR